MTIEQEQRAFEQQLDALLSVHGGEYVLFKDGAPVAFFATTTDAYSAGLDRFGPDEVFLVAQVAKAAQLPSTSLSWELGVLFG
jgi:hypothetical protein